MSSLWLDVRHAFRMMVKSPGLTAVLAITLALGIGASTTIFSVVHSIVLKPLPYDHPDRIARVYTAISDPKNPLPRFWFSVPELGELTHECRSCAAVAGWIRGSAPLAGGDRPVRIEVAYTTASLSAVLGVKPLLGRWFDASEDTPMPPSSNGLVGDPTVIVLGYDIWQRAFAGDPHVLGRRVTLDGIPVTVVGVMPKGFDFLDGEQAWVSGRFDFGMKLRGSHAVNVVVRMAPGTSVASLNDELAALSAQLGKRQSQGFHSLRPEHPLVAVPFHEDVVGSIATTLWLLQGAVLFVLLISIVNVANLLLARSETRTREVAVRHALGASRSRLLRQFVTESLILGVLGGGLGTFVALWAVDGVRALIPKSAPRASEISLDTTAVLFAAGCAVVASLLFGLAPIVHARRTDIHGALKDGSPRMTGSKARLRARRALVISEIAIAVLLVIGCSVMVSSFVRLQNVPLGFQPDKLLTFGVNLPLKGYPPNAANQFWDRLEQRLRVLPGVRGAATIDGIVPQRTITVESIDFPGRAHTPDEPVWVVDYWQLLGAHGIEVLGGKVVRGRDIADSDVEGAPRVILVNEAFVKKFFPKEDPLGKLVTTYYSGDPKLDKPATIVGVVADIKNAGVDKPAANEIFMPRMQYGGLADPPMAPLYEYVAVRTIGNPADLIPAVHRAVAEIDPQVPLYDVRTMDDLLWESVARPRFLTFLLTSFAVLALVLAAVGIYGVMAHTVAQRTHEIGVRVALGAQPKQVRAMVLRQAGMLVASGIALGLAGAVVLQVVLDSSLQSLFYGSRLSQPLLLVGVAIAVAATALFATWIPARRATKIEPSIALRAE